MKRNSTRLVAAMGLVVGLTALAAPGTAGTIPADALVPDQVQASSSSCDTRWIEAVGGPTTTDDEQIGVSACEPGVTQDANWDIDNYSWSGSCSTGLGDPCDDIERHDVQKCSYVQATFEDTGETDFDQVGDNC